MEYMIDYTAIGDRIRYRRRQQKWSQQTLAEKANVDTSYISQIERGVTHVSLPTLAAIASAFDCSLDELVSDSASSRQTFYVNSICSILEDASEEELSLATALIAALHDNFHKKEKG